MKQLFTPPRTKESDRIETRKLFKSKSKVSRDTCKRESSCFALLCIAVSLFFGSCSTEETLVKEEKKAEVKLQTVSFSELSKNRGALNAYQKYKSKAEAEGLQARGLSLYNMVVDTSRIFYTEKDNLKSYTMEVLDFTTSDTIRNLILAQKDNLSYDVILSEYFITPEERSTLINSNIIPDKLPSKLLVLNQNQDYQTYAIDYLCIELITRTYSFCRDGEGNVIPNQGYLGDECVGMSWSEEITTLIIGSCLGSGIGGSPYIPGSSGGSQPPPNQGGTPNIGPYPTPGTPVQPPPFVTTPVVISARLDAQLRQELNEAQIQWWNAADPEIKAALLDLLLFWNQENLNGVIGIINDGIENSTSGDLVMQNMITSIALNDGYSGDNFEDEDLDNTDYFGPKQFIPENITLSDGSVVSVIFGTTESDGINANQKVASRLVDAIVFALENANANLLPNDKITSIYIEATTNGSHGATSNHPRGTAVDISRINGIKMIYLGANSQVVALQNAFDSFSYIRENFGPYFKHKTFPNGTVNLNWPIRGHKDHIHASVQSN